MRSISSALSTALGAPVQQPAVLVQIGFATTLRYSSGQTTPWNSQTWISADIAVEGLRVAAFRVSGTLVVGNTDGVFGGLCVTEGVQDKLIRIWAFDAAATATNDVVWLCDAQGAATSIDTRAVRIALRHRCELMIAPRTVVGADAGFTQRIPAGSVLRINGVDYKLERAT